MAYAVSSSKASFSTSISTVRRERKRPPKVEIVCYSTMFFSYSRQNRRMRRHVRYVVRVSKSRFQVSLQP